MIDDYDINEYNQNNRNIDIIINDFKGYFKLCCCILIALCVKFCV